jgi:hypothetical protein
MAPIASSEPLPPLYQKWVFELLGGAIPRESRATCDNCAMCSEKEHEAGTQSYFFDPTTKCCTFVPHLHNFLVGRILSDTDPVAQFGRATVEKRIKQGLGVSPLGLAQPPVFSLLYRESTDSFGKSRTMSCPHYVEDGGRCGIWQNRNSTCVTWFCKHVKGHVGYNFWRNSLHRLLKIVEFDLSRWCLLELQVSNKTLRNLVETEGWSDGQGAVTADALDNKVDRKEYAEIWGEWLGREHDFFRRCADLVNPLSWAEALAIAAPEARIYARLTQEAYCQLMSQEIPSSLKVGPFQLVQIENSVSRVNSYNQYDPLDVPQAMMELLPYFDGQSTERALAAIAKERNITLDAELVRKVVDFKVLVPADRSG